MDPITPTQKELDMIARNRARKAQTAAKNKSKAIAVGLDKVAANLTNGNNAPIRCNGYLFVPMDNGETHVWRKGVRVTLDAPAETVEAPTVETTGEPAPAPAPKRSRKNKAAQTA